jgi:hypothetical protein
LQYPLQIIYSFAVYQSAGARPKTRAWAGLVGRGFLGLDFFGYFFGQCKKVTKPHDGQIKKLLTNTLNRIRTVKKDNSSIKAKQNQIAPKPQLKNIL